MGEEMFLPSVCAATATSVHITIVTVKDFSATPGTSAISLQLANLLLWQQRFQFPVQRPSHVLFCPFSRPEKLSAVVHWARECQVLGLQHSSTRVFPITQPRLRRRVFPRCVLPSSSRPDFRVSSRIGFSRLKWF